MATDIDERITDEQHRIWAAAHAAELAAIPGLVSIVEADEYACRAADAAVERAALRLAVLRFRLELAEGLEVLAARLRGAR